MAAVKAKILSTNPNTTIVDISHEIEAFHISHAAFVLGAVFKDFPAGTVHLATVDMQGREEVRYIALKLEEHYFVGPDNGLFSILSEKSPSLMIELPNDPLLSMNFPEKNILAPAAAQLARGAALYDIGRQAHNMVKLITRQARVSKNEMEGRVSHIDKYGNLITNIKLNDFTEAAKNRPAKIRIGRTVVDGINTSYARCEGGDCICLFNSLGLLEISIIQGHAAKLLGMKYDSPISISFSPLFE